LAAIMKIVMDSDVLIKLTKIGSKEIVGSHLDLSIPRKVSEETAMSSGSFADAKLIQRNINEGIIHVSESFSHERGEVEALNLYRSGGFELIASDDKRFLNFLERNNIPFLTSSSLLVYLLYKNKLSKNDTIKYINNLRPHISNAQYSAAMSEVEKWEK